MNVSLADDLGDHYQGDDENNQYQPADIEGGTEVAQRISLSQGGGGGQGANGVKQAARKAHHVATYHQDRHRFADGPAGFQDYAGEKARFGGRQDDVADG